MFKLKLDDIRISKNFEKTIPSYKKIADCEAYWNNYGEQDRYIVVNNNNMLIDGYIQYLVLKDKGVEYAECICSEKKNDRLKRKPVDDGKVTYIYGMHYLKHNNTWSKEYVWRVPKYKNSPYLPPKYHIGEEVIVTTKRGFRTIVITKIDTSKTRPSNLPIEMRIRTVVCKKEPDKTMLECLSLK